MGRVPLAEIRLEPGDTILLGGTDKVRPRESHDLLVLDGRASRYRSAASGIAVLIFAGIVLTAAFDIVPIAAASIVGAF